MKTNLCLLVVAVLLTWLNCSVAVAGDWPQFRGPDGRGISDETEVPLFWGRDHNVRWRVELPGPGNNGSPIVSKGAVFVIVATDEGRQRSLHCYDRDSGQLRWTRAVEFDGREPTHGTNHYGGSTPAADGERVVVWHSSAGMHCYDYAGQTLWSRDLGSFIHIWGYGGSPIIWQDLVINNCGPGEQQRVVALNKQTGEIVWETPEPGGTTGRVKPWIGSWSTPVVAGVDGRDQLLVSYPHHVNAYDPKSGKILWHCGGLGNLVYTSCLVGDGLGVSMGGYHGPAIGFRLGGNGDVTDGNHLWRMEKNPQRIGSGVILGKHLFMVDERGTVQCLDPATGRAFWKDQLSGSNRLWSSLVAAASRLYVTTQAGDTFVFSADPQKFELLATNRLGEKSNSTIAVSDCQIYLRTWKALYCIEEGR